MFITDVTKGGRLRASQQLVYNRAAVRNPTRDVSLWNASIERKHARKRARDTWETMLTHMRCGEGGMVETRGTSENAQIASSPVVSRGRAE